MSQENVELVRREYERFITGELAEDLITPEFVWDMSKFAGWPEQQTYNGFEGMNSFLTNWTSSWDDWELTLVDLLDAGEKVVALMHQTGRSKTTGAVVEMSFAQVWTVRDGKRTRMEMYSDPAEALQAEGLVE
jgi:ketosteroid isomerase-like protein